MESEFITADAVVAGEFAHFAVKYNVRGVPKTVMNETVEILGAKPERVFVSRVLEAASE